MSDANSRFAGRWLHHGDWHGKEFTHEMPHYDHDESPGGDGSTAMRHAVIEHVGTSVGVWIPANWTDDQARAALATNW